MLLLHSFGQFYRLSTLYQLYLFILKLRSLSANRRSFDEEFLSNVGRQTINGFLTGSCSSQSHRPLS